MQSLGNVRELFPETLVRAVMGTVTVNYMCCSLPSYRMAVENKPVSTERTQLDFLSVDPLCFISVIHGAAACVKTLAWS